MKIKNWKKFQHFKDRRPPWIKLHREILEQRDINTISDRAFRLLVNLWVLASDDKEMVGNLPEISDIAWKLRKSEKEIAELLQELTPWIDHSDIEVISPCQQPVPPETEAYKEETEAKGEKKDTTPAQNVNIEEDWKTLLLSNWPHPTIPQQEVLKLWIKRGKKLDQFESALIATSAAKGDAKRWQWVTELMNKEEKPYFDPNIENF